jgi:hypothetical protein
MAYTGIFCSKEEIEYKAGVRCNLTSKSEAYLNSFVAQAESYINAACKFNFSDVYSSLNTDVKKILSEAASNLAAIYSIQYDLSGTDINSSQRIDAEDMINILYKRAMDCIEILKNEDNKQFIVNA